MKPLAGPLPRPPSSRMSISAEDADSFAQASEAHIEQAGSGLSAVLRRLFGDGG